MICRVAFILFYNVHMIWDKDVYIVIIFVVFYLLYYTQHIFLYFMSTHALFLLWFPSRRTQACSNSGIDICND